MLTKLVILVVAVVLLSGLRIAREYQRGVVFRLGRYTGLRGPGLYWIIPLGIERSVTIDIRTRTVAAERQETITRDSVTVKLNAVIWYHIVDAGKSVIAVSDAAAAVYQLALTSLRNIGSTTWMRSCRSATRSMVCCARTSPARAPAGVSRWSASR